MSHPNPAMTTTEKKLHTLSKQAKQISLTQKDKYMLRSNIEAFVNLNPIVTNVTAREKIGEMRRKIHPHVVSLFRGVTAGVIGAVLISGGVASAATGALPGEALYPVKINLNEKVRSLVAVTPEAQAKLQTEFAETRLREAEKLAVRGELSPQVKQSLETRFEAHTQASENSLQGIKGPHKEEVAAEIRSDFEAALTAHEELLSQIASNLSATSVPDKNNMLATRIVTNASGTASLTGTSTAKNISGTSTTFATSSQDAEKETNEKNSKIVSLLDWLREKKEEISGKREDSEQKMIDRAASETENLALRAKVAANTQIDEAEHALKHDGDDVPSLVREEAKTHIQEARTREDQADAELQKGEYTDAFETFREAMREALKAEVLLKTSVALDLYSHIKDFDTLMKENTATAITATEEASTSSSSEKLLDNHVNDATGTATTSSKNGATATTTGTNISIIATTTATTSATSTVGGTTEIDKRLMKTKGELDLELQKNAQLEEDDHDFTMRNTIGAMFRFF